MHDPLGDRLKGEFESKTRLLLPRQTHTIIRLDGRAFHAYTRGLPRPFESTLHSDLVEAAIFLCEQVAGAAFAYVQSDEVSLLVTDLAKPTTVPWFGGSVQKIASVSASILTAKFNELRYVIGSADGEKLAIFDSRVFTIADPEDVTSYFEWRYLDAWRNAVSSLASVHFSPKQLHRKSLQDRLVMLYEAGVDVRETDPRFRSGSVIESVARESTVTYVDRRGDEQTVEGVVRRVWETQPAPSVYDVVDGQGGFPRFSSWVDRLLATLHTPREPGGTVAPDATPGVATRPASS